MQGCDVLAWCHWAICSGTSGALRASSSTQIKRLIKYSQTRRASLRWTAVGQVLMERERSVSLWRNIRFFQFWECSRRMLRMQPNNSCSSSSKKMTSRATHHNTARAGIAHSPCHPFICSLHSETCGRSRWLVRPPWPSKTRAKHERPRQEQSRALHFIESKWSRKVHDWRHHTSARLPTDTCSRRVRSVGKRNSTVGRVRVL